MDEVTFYFVACAGIGAVATALIIAVRATLELRLPKHTRLPIKTLFNALRWTLCTFVVYCLLCGGFWFATSWFFAARPAID